MRRRAHGLIPVARFMTNPQGQGYHRVRRGAVCVRCVPIHLSYRSMRLTYVPGSRLVIHSNNNFLGSKSLETLRVVSLGTDLESNFALPYPLCVDCSLNYILHGINFL